MTFKQNLKDMKFQQKDLSLRKFMLFWINVSKRLNVQNYIYAIWTTDILKSPWKILIILLVSVLQWYIEDYHHSVNNTINPLIMLTLGGQKEIWTCGGIECTPSHKRGGRLKNNMVLGARFQKLRVFTIREGPNTQMERGELNSQSGLDSWGLPGFSANVLFLWQQCY